MRSWLWMTLAGTLGCGSTKEPALTPVPTVSTSDSTSNSQLTETSETEPLATLPAPPVTRGPLPPVPPEIVQEQDPCGIMDCETGRGCCHNPNEREFNAVPREFLVDCLPEGQSDAPLDSSCEDYSCETRSCLWQGCRLDSGQCGVLANRYLRPGGGGDIHSMEVDLPWGCVDERWLIRRNPSGVPPDPTLECAVDYWSDAGTAESLESPDAAVSK